LVGRPCLDRTRVFLAASQIQQSRSGSIRSFAQYPFLACHTAESSIASIFEFLEASNVKLTSEKYFGSHGSTTRFRQRVSIAPAQTERCGRHVKTDEAA